MSVTMQKRRNSESIPTGASVYTKASLRVYDFIVHFLSNRLAWKCPTQNLVEHCQMNVTPNHLEVGIGSGKLFRNSINRQTFDRLVLADVNPACLDVAKNTLKKQMHQTWELNLLNEEQDLARHQDFDSIGLNYVLHCLPASFPEKLAICDRLIEYCLKPGGVLFGATLFPTINNGWIAAKLMNFYNRKGIFSNEGDPPDGLKSWLSQSNGEFQFFAIGSVGLFSVRKP